MSVSFYQHKGSYDWLHPDKEQWQVVLRVGGDRASEVFDEEQMLDDMLPSDVAMLLLERAESYLYNGGLERTRKVVMQVLDNASEIDDSYLLDQIHGLERQIQRLKSRLSGDSDE